MKELVTIIDLDTAEAIWLMTPDAPIIEGAIVQRGSHVEPVNPILRCAFHLLRQWLGDKGRMSNFTRSWPCLWRVNMKPVGGPILPQTYVNRLAAIDAEVVALNKFFIEGTI